MSAKHDVAQYYNQTQNHYERWWQLEEGMALHYGIWLADTINFLEALENTSRIMMEQIGVETGCRVLDAGCGVGGSAIYLARQKNTRVSGITLSEKQLQTATSNASKHEVESLVDFSLQDYTNTTFPNNTFDVIWACESISSTSDKSNFAQEAYRLLKPGGRIVLSDFFKTNEEAHQSDNLLQQWSDSWAMAPLVTSEELARALKTSGFKILKEENFTGEIHRTAKKLYRGYLFGSIPSRVYNFIFGASRYSRNHYSSGHYQYKALELGLWQYKVMSFTKA